MIRKEIKTDGTFGGNYPFDMEYAILPEKFIEITEEQRDYIDNNLSKLRYVNGEIKDISDTPEYIAEQRLKEIEQELANEDIIFAQKGEIIKEFNGKPYKIKYANDYQSLVLPAYIDETDKKDIWDATELEYISMTKSELLDLYNFLKPDYEFAFQVRKTNRAKLLLEKESLK